jgi:V8-like Glu-specific endopeptidase
VQYWTPEQAGPAETQPEEALGLDIEDVEALAAGQYPYAYSRYDVASSLYTGSGRKFPYTAVGKLFFTLFGTNYVCSASVIRPHLLLTARHCIFDYASQKWATNVVFYPGYYQGSNSALGGAWYARALITYTTGASGWEYDIGFIQTFNQKRTGCKATSTNRQIESYTGYLGHKYGGSYSNRQFDDLGYPQAYPFTGKVMVQCSAGTGLVNSRGVANTVEIGCDQSGGCSGGPWLNGFAPGVASSTKNQATSVNSFRWSDRPKAINGPQFMTKNFYNLLTKATNQSCP